VKRLLALLTTLAFGALLMGTGCSGGSSSATKCSPGTGTLGSGYLVDNVGNCYYPVSAA
jgi:hypothetical protein